MDISITIRETSPGCIVVSVEGVIDVYTSERLKNRLLELADQYDEIALDLYQTHTIDSVGLGMMITIHKLVWLPLIKIEHPRPTRCRCFYLAETMKPTIRQLFRKVGLDKPGGLLIGRPITSTKAE